MTLCYAWQAPAAGQNLLASFPAAAWFRIELVVPAPETPSADSIELPLVLLPRRLTEDSGDREFPSVELIFGKGVAAAPCGINNVAHTSLCWKDVSGRLKSRL